MGAAIVSLDLEGAGTGTREPAERVAVRPRRWLVVAVGMAVIGSVVALGLGLRWRSHYQPLTIDYEQVQTGDRLTAGLYSPGGSIHDVGVVGLQVDATASEDAAMRASAIYHDDAQLTLGLAFHNTGRVGVTITGFDLPGPNQYFLTSVLDVRVGRRLAGGMTSVLHTVPFRPFTLRPNETRDVVVRERMHACEWNEPGSSNAMTALGVHYRVLGLTRHTALETPVQVVVSSPVADECPRPPRY